MPYTLELYFTGLCTFVPDLEKKECTVLLVNASDPEREFAGRITARPNPHSPVLAVPLEYVVIKPDTYRTPIIVPDGTGKSIAIFDLDGDDLVLDVEREDPDFAAVATTRDIYHPESFLWTLDLEEYGEGSNGLRADALDLKIPLPCYLSTRFWCKNGSLSTHKPAVDQKGRLLPFQPRSVDHLVTVPGSKPQPIADYSVLHIENLDAPIVRFHSKTKGTIGLSTQGDRITATLTNQDTSPEVDQSKILDFLWYYKLLSYNSALDYKKALIPWAVPQHETKITPSTSSCPPTRIKMKKPAQTNKLADTSEQTTGLSALEIALLPAAERAERANEVDAAELVQAGSSSETFPDCVALIRDDSPEATAVVIHPRAVLTAGHVAEGAKSLSVRIGEDALDPGAETVLVEGNPILPKGYLKAHDCADLALLILDQAVSVTPRGIPLASIAVGVQGTIVGFGQDTVQGEPYGQKQRANLTVKAAPFTPLKSVTCTETSEFLAARLSGVASHGDSGAPFYELRAGNLELVGLAVRTVLDAASGKYESAILDLPKYRTWIEAEMKKKGLTL